MVSMKEIKDKLAIQELMARYNFALDSGDIETWANCFTEDGVLESPFGTQKGRPALRQYLSERAVERREKPLRHLAMNIVIDVQGDRASAKCYLLLVRIVPDGVQLLTSGVYQDELRKMRGTWYFSHRKVQPDSKAWASQVFPSSYLEESVLGQKITKSNEEV